MAAISWLFVTLLLYYLADQLYNRAGRHPLLHPVFLPCAVLLAALWGKPESIEAYQAGTWVFGPLLGAAASALAVPLYRNFSALKVDPPAVIAALVGGSVAGTGSALLAGYLLSAPSNLMATLAAKSITTPMAIGVATALGGIPSLAAAIVILTGLMVAVCAPPLLRIFGVDEDIAIGLAMGTAGHGLGMAEAVRRSDLMGAAAAFAMATNGMISAFLLPLVWPLFL